MRRNEAQSHIQMVLLSLLLRPFGAFVAKTYGTGIAASHSLAHSALASVCWTCVMAINHTLYIHSDGEVQHTAAKELFTQQICQKSPVTKAQKGFSS